MKKIIPLIVLITFIFIALPVYAQSTDELILDFNRDFGYGGFGGEIQGRFSIKVSSPDDLVRVEYFLDDEMVFEGTEPDFKWQFNTAAFSEGHHTFSAIGYKADGTFVQASEFSRVFLSSDQAWNKMGDILVPLLIIVGIATIGGVLGPVLLGRKKLHTPGTYGMAGGAICARCSFPFSRSMVAPNLLVGKLGRCPHCGKWAIVPRASVGDLEEAEKRFASEGQGTIEVPTEEEKLQQMIEDSRYEE